MKSYLVYILILLSIISMSQTSFAQFSFGATGGISISSYTVSNPYEKAEFSTRTGYVLGAVLDYNFYDTFTVRLNPQYISLGGENSMEFISYGATEPTIFQNEVVFDYIEISALLMYKIFTINRIDFSVCTGLSFGYLESYNAKTKNLNNGSEPTIFGKPAKDDFEDYHTALEFGLEAKYKLNDKFSVLSNGLYKLGIQDILKRDSEIKLKSFIIKLGVLYSI